MTAPLPNHTRPLAARLADEAEVVAVTDPSHAALLRESASALAIADANADAYAGAMRDLAATRELCNAYRIVLSHLGCVVGDTREAAK